MIPITYIDLNGKYIDHPGYIVGLAIDRIFENKQYYDPQKNIRTAQLHPTLWLRNAMYDIKSLGLPLDRITEAVVQMQDIIDNGGKEECIAVMEAVASGYAHIHGKNVRRVQM